MPRSSGAVAGLRPTAHIWSCTTRLRPHRRRRRSAGSARRPPTTRARGALVVLRNGAVLTVSVFDDGSGTTDEATRLDQMKQIAAAAAGRM